MTSLPVDEALVAGLRSGDETTFAQVLDSWTPAMLRVAQLYVSTYDSAAEVVQDTWLAVIRGIGDFQGRSTLRTWVFRILANIAQARGAKEQRTVPWSSLVFGDEDTGPTVDPSRFRGADDPYPGHWREPPAPWRSPESSALDREVRSLLGEAIQALPPRQRIVVELRDVEGYTSAEVCTMLELSPANQRVLLHRGRAALRSRLESYLATPSTSAGAGVAR